MDVHIFAKGNILTIGIRIRSGENCPFLNPKLLTNNVEELVRNRNIKTIATHVKHIISKYVVEPLPRHSFDIKSHGTQEKLTNIYKRKQQIWIGHGLFTL